MPPTDELVGIQSEIDKCMRCGFCMAVCPVYGVEKDEKAVARGKIAVIQAVLDGELEIDDPQVTAALFNCLVCTSCVQNCPTGVRVDRIVIEARAAMARKNGLPWVKAAIFGALRDRGVLDLTMKTGAALAGLAFREHPRLKAISPRAPFAILGQSAGMDSQRLLPVPNARPLSERLPERIPVLAPKARVAFFTGCSFQYFYPTAGSDLVEVLTANGADVTVPREQLCCGTPVLVHGDLPGARDLARRNLDAMERSGAEYVVTGCGSCGSAFQHSFPNLLADDPVYTAKAAYWAARTYDVSTLLVKVIGYRPPTGQVDAVVTYHDPCHLKKSMKVSAEPRQILNSIPGVILREMAKPDACCGSGGSYVLTHTATAGQIATKKGADIAQTGASTVATGCPACMMQLLDTVNRTGGRQRVRHYISVLAESYRNENNHAGKESDAESV
ncbi:MAG TPA: (Fe-S)-binding protein [Bryobacteraceae bacterium]|nr:(Fe-S)-binding protein [Bryobacteraceae bacterium]